MVLVAIGNLFRYEYEMTKDKSDNEFSRKELLGFLKNTYSNGHFKQNKSLFLFISFCVVNGFMFSNSLYIIIQSVFNGYDSPIGELARSILGLIASLFIFAYLRLVIPKSLMTFNIVNNKINMTAFQHVISTVVVLIPAALFLALMMFLNGSI